MHNINEAHRLDVYTLNYSGFGVIAIKGIQELQSIVDSEKEINTKQAATINDLQNRITKLEALINTSSLQNNSQAATGFNDASLEQNNPNPFNQNTVIRYHLATGNKGQINISDVNGNLIKTIAADATGIVNLNNSNLSAGTYTYTLILNGKTMASKKMIVVK